MAKNIKTPAPATISDEAKALRELFAAGTDLSQAAFGKAFDIGTQGMVWQYLHADTALNLEAALKFARGLKCSVADFSPRLAEILAYENSTVGDPIPITRTGRIPVTGRAMGGLDGILNIDDYPAGEGYGYVSLYSPDENAYAVRVEGDSMAPRMRSGDFVVVEPNFEALPGDEAVVTFTNGSSVVKMILWIRDGDVSLGSINNGVSAITRPFADITSMHRVAAILPRGTSLFSKE
ncbi:MAG: hypothetical protein LBI35_09445 [Burkholderiales bacterium]|jgi:hypothetical protein|nr:hypothetical protein [Burkholderiales bacterium]